MTEEEEQTTRDRQQREIIKHQDALERRREIERWMQSYEGRKIICWLLDLSGVFAPTFSAENPHVTSYNEGAREKVGMVLQTEVLAAAPTQYYQLMVENAERMRDGRR